MGVIKIIESNKLSDRMNGRHQLVQIERVKNPFQKKQWIKATVTLKPATFTAKAVTESHIYYDDFMSVVQKVQSRWPGKTSSYQTLNMKPDWAKKQGEQEV